jgi:callose synthase
MLSADAGSRRGSSASFLQTSNADMTNNNTETQSLLGTDPKRLQSYVNRLLDVRVQKWVMFSVAWNKIIDHFRQEDIISNRERDYLKFSTFDGFSQAIYLPVFQTAGIIENALTELERPSDEYTSRLGLVTDDKLFKPILDHVTMKTAVSEVWELGSYIFVQLLSSIHNNDVVAIMNLILKWTEEGNMVQHLRMEKIRSVVNNFVEVVKILQKGIGRRKPASKKRSTGKKVVRQEMRRPVVSGIRRSISASSLSGSSLQSKAEKGSEPEKSTAVVVVADALRDQVRDKFRAMAHAIKGLLKNAEHDNESRDLVDRITFLLSMENGFLWDDAYASDQLDNVCKNQTFKEVLTKIHGLVACHPDDAEPKSKEARRRLTFFVNTLFMDIPEAPSIKDMFSWNVITPYYSEDVMI